MKAPELRSQNTIVGAPESEIVSVKAFELVNSSVKTPELEITNVKAPEPQKSNVKAPELKFKSSYLLLKIIFYGFSPNIFANLLLRFINLSNHTPHLHRKE